MTRETVDFGIDLGTTTSAIAVARGADADIVRNTLRREFTPSAVYMSRSGNIRVGEKARQIVEDDPQNTHAEFKIQMGVKDAHRTFEAAGRTMTPEQLSAEVLKSLRQNVANELKEAIAASVITVPAAFELDQCDATRRAAALAGLEFAPLLQEPTAAAWAYSATATDVPRRGFWLVYDLGGGTFDAAVIQVDDGEFTVVNHAGDNHLGGKLIDWALVDDVLIPAARALPGMAGFDRSDERFRSAVARLKHAAEDAKVALSQVTSFEVEVDLRGADLNPVPFEHVLTRADVERAAMPRYRRSIELCRRALSEKGLAPGDIERVLLVGGATLAPPLRELLADPTEGLGIRLDHTLDPVTVVARGAAVFARTQRLPGGLAHHGPDAGADAVLLEFAHRPTGRGSDPLAGGRARTADPAADGGRDWTGYTIEFVNSAAGQLEWRSGQVPLAPNGSFTARLSARTEENVYAIEFRNPHGTLVPTRPDHTTYQRRGFEGGDATMSHSVGVWVEGNEVAWILRKGAELPNRGRLVLESIVDVRRGERTGLIKVPIVQGERARADRNSVIGALDVRPEHVSRDVPVGSEVEVELEIDESFGVQVQAYIPVLDEEFEIPVDFGRQTPDLDGLRAKSRTVADQYRELRERASASRAEQTTALLDEFDQQGGIEGISRELDSAQGNPDGPAACQEMIRRAESVLDEAEEALELPQLAERAASVRRLAQEVIEEYGDAAIRRELNEAGRELDAALAAGDATLAEHHLEAVRNILVRVLDHADRLPVIRFAWLRENLSAGDPRALRLLAEGEAALATNNIARLRGIVIELSRLLPPDALAPDGSVDTTVRVRR